MTEKETIDLILKILTETATIAEREYFARWLSESSGHSTYYNQIIAIWEQLSHTYDSLVFDEAAAREKIMAGIKRHNSKARDLRTRYWIAAAASILLLCTLGFLLIIRWDDFGKNVIAYSTINDEKKEIVLPDSTHVWLNENTTLTLTARYNRMQRKVDLDGEAYFEVQRDETRSFKVRTGMTITRVLGTSFNLRQKENGNVSLCVKSGSVEFYRKNSFRQRDKYTAGYRGDFIVANNQISMKRNEDANYLSWKTGILTFNNTSLEEICKILSRYYDKKVITTIRDHDLSLTGTFENETLEEIIKTIELTLDIRAEINADRITIYE